MTQIFLMTCSSLTILLSLCWSVYSFSQVRKNTIETNYLYSYRYPSLSCEFLTDGQVYALHRRILRVSFALYNRGGASMGPWRCYQSSSDILLSHKLDSLSDYDVCLICVSDVYVGQSLQGSLNIWDKFQIFHAVDDPELRWTKIAWVRNWTAQIGRGPQHRQLTF